MANYGKLNFSVAFNPTSAFPIDSRCLFSSYAEAENAAKKAQNVGSTSTVYFYGMIFTVVDKTENTVKHYSVELDNTLKELGNGGNSEIDTSQFITISQIGKNLEIDEKNKVNVKTAEDFNGDNTRPITAAATQSIVGNINVLLKTI